jgi:hypothetical protein
MGFGKIPGQIKTPPLALRQKLTMSSRLTKLLSVLWLRNVNANVPDACAIPENLARETQDRSPSPSLCPSLSLNDNEEKFSPL